MFKKSMAIFLTVMMLVSMFICTPVNAETQPVSIPGNDSTSSDTVANVVYEEPSLATPSDALSKVTVAEEVYNPIPENAIVDNFDSATLGSAWQIINEDDTKWSLTEKPGSLVIHSLKGDTWTTDNSAKNLILRDMPNGDFKVIAKFKANVYENYMGAGILIWQDWDNYLRVGHTYVGFAGGVVIENGLEIAQAYNSTFTLRTGDEEIIMVERKGNDFITSYWDGQKWVQAAKVTAALNNLKVGVYALSSLNSAEVAAEFDYFAVVEPERQTVAAPSKPFVLKAASNSMYVYGDEQDIDPNYGIRAKLIQTELGRNVVFAAEQAADGYVALKNTVTGKYMTALPAAEQGKVFIGSAEVSNAEQFKLIDAGGGKVALLSRASGEYVTVKNNELFADASSVISAEKFVFEEYSVGQGQLIINADQPGIVMSENLYGVFFEDINHAADGGLYAEMVRNRSFEFNSADGSNLNGLTAWQLVQRGGGSASIKVENDVPLNSKNLNYLTLTITDAGTGVGIMNIGYNIGLNIQKDENYNFSFYARRTESFDQPVKIRLESTDGTLYGEAQVFVDSNEWEKYTATIKANASDTKGRLVVLTTGTGTVYLDMISLFPEHTFKNRLNGMRADIAQMIADLKPKFLRFPGGCIVHAGSYNENAPYRVYRWKDTLGDVAERPVSASMWSGNNQSFGIGFYEYFQFAEDIGAKPVPHVTAGIDPHPVPGERDGWYYVPLDQMQPWIQNALDLIEFANGDKDTTVWGRKRAELGHPEPFNLEYIGIGNEDINKEYSDRFKLFQQAINEKYPEIKVISSSGPFSQGSEFDYGWKFSKEVNADMVDEHYYNSPTWFLNNWHRYDSYDRNGPKVFIGEYASQGNTFYNALAEAAYMTGIERNSDIIEFAAYAPLLANTDYVNWTPDLIWFNNSQVYGSVNYYVQKMFSNNKGDVVLPTTFTGTAGDQKEPDSITGGIGLGSWATQVQYDDVVVKNNTTGETLFSDDFSNGSSKWTASRGTWAVNNGVYVQTSSNTDCRSTAGDVNWSNYTLTLKAKKTGGNEGFLIIFGRKDSNNYYWWNIGGWNNTQHAIEKAVAGSRSSITTKSGSIQTGKEYNIKIEVCGTRIRCYLDEELIHDFNDRPDNIEPLYYVTTKDNSTGDIIMKVVNVRDSAMNTQVTVNGVEQILPEGTATVMTASSLTDVNSFGSPTKVVPVTKEVTGLGKNFTYEFPKHSITILRLKTTESNDTEGDFTVTPSFNLTSLQPNKLLTANVTVKNNKSDENSVLAIVALYDAQDRMVNVSYISKEIPVGVTEDLCAGFKLPANVDGYKVKVFVWDGTSLDATTMQPLSNVVELQ
jgi:alpha-L-arabinofuranosidase